MKQFHFLFILALVTACSSSTEKTVNTEPEKIPDESGVKKSSEVTDSMGNVIQVIYQTSTYDDKKMEQRINDHRSQLEELSNKGVFSAMHKQLVTGLTSDHRSYFERKPNYAVLTAVKGKLFLKDNNDCAFVVYDKKNKRVSIVLYWKEGNRYGELFRDVFVENGLEDTDCNYGAFGTIDYQLAEEILYQKDGLMENPLRYTESPVLRINNISKDEDFALKSGCFAKGMSGKNAPMSLSVSTSSTYNNWESLKYDETKKCFVIYYGQAFAD